MSYDEMNKIIDHLYITNWPTSDNPIILKRNNIKKWGLAFFILKHH